MKRKPAGIALKIIIWVVFLTVSCDGETPEETIYAIHSEGVGNEVIVETEENSVLFDVSSEPGIGAASIAVITGEFPHSVALNLHLTALEELRFAYGETEVLVSVSSSQGNAVRESVILGSGEAQQESPITPASPYWLDVVILQEDSSPGTIPLNGGVILVSAPEDFSAGRYDSFFIRWIDFYR